MNTATIKITAVERKEGAKNGRPWTKFIVHAEDGGKYSTFDAALSTIAFAAVGQLATATFETGEYGHDLKALVVGPAPPDAASPFGSPLPAPTGSVQVPPAQPQPFSPAASNDAPDWDLIGLRKTRCALWAALFGSGIFKGSSSVEAANYCAILVKAAEADIFGRPGTNGPGGGGQDDIPFQRTFS